jgi:hypothetical protein
MNDLVLVELDELKSTCALSKASSRAGLHVWDLVAGRKTEHGDRINMEQDRLCGSPASTRAILFFELLKQIDIPFYTKNKPPQPSTPYRQRELTPKTETSTKWKVGLTSSIPSQLSRFFHQPTGRQPAPPITDAHGHLEWPFGLLCGWEEGDDFF